MRILSFLLLLGTCLSARAQNSLFIPDTLSGASITLTLQSDSTSFFSGAKTATLGANGAILGPTLFLHHGDPVQLNVINQLMDTTTIHWHGLHVAPENDGGPHTYILPNGTWSPSFTPLDRAATFWYHPHLHHMTDMHVSKGIAGMIIMRDSAERALPLPRTYGVDDIPLVVQTKDFNANNQIVVHSNSDDVVMVNATINPTVSLPANVVRLRLLNGSSQRTFQFGFSSNLTFFQIASDGGLLGSPVSLTRLPLAPGERAEILVDLTSLNGQSVQLMSYANELANGIYGATNPGMGAGMTLTGYNPNPLNGTAFQVLDIQVGAALSNGITSIPSALVPVNSLAGSTANQVRTLTFSPTAMGMNQLNGTFRINGATFQMGVINETVPLNNIEIWQLSNQSGIAHPFHIHDVQFNIISRNGATPPLNEQGWKDVVLVKPMETVQFITKFEDFANDSIPYMYHCHLLTHEDGGMMGQFIVQNTISVDESPAGINFQVYPNPGHGACTISFAETPERLLVHDASGRLIQEHRPQSGSTQVHVEGLKPGVYLFHAHYTNVVISERVVMH